MIQDIAVAVILVGTLAGILIRPWGRSETWPAAVGALLVVAIGAAGLDDIRATFEQTADVLLFLLGMMLLSWVADRAGVVAWLAEGCAVMARGSGPALFAAVVILAAVVTVLLALDTSVNMLTPIVYRLAVRRQLDPLPMLFACVFVANIGSLLLPVSNLSNLLMYRRLELDFGGFAARIWSLDLFAVAATGLVLALKYGGTVNVCKILTQYTPRHSRTGREAGSWEAHSCQAVARVTRHESARLCGDLGPGMEVTAYRSQESHESGPRTARIRGHRAWQRGGIWHTIAQGCLEDVPACRVSRLQPRPQGWARWTLGAAGRPARRWLQRA